MKQRILQSLFFFLIACAATAQPFRTPTFTGNAFSDFTATERSNLMGDLAYEMTWDANFLYVGVSATATYAKLQPTIIYLDLDPKDSPSAGNGSQTGQNYDGRVGTMPFKADAVIYMKHDYAELRRFITSSWADYYQNITANVVNGTNDIENKISWSDVGGRPASFRYIIFKENGGGGTDAYSIYPNGFAAIPNVNNSGYNNDINSTPFGSSQYIYIADTNNGAHTANTTVSDCPKFALAGTTCLPLALTTSQNTGNNNYSITLNNTTTAQNFVYTINNTGSAATSYATNFAFQPSTTTPLPAGNYSVSSVTLASAAGTGASPQSCPNSFSATGSVSVSGTAPAPSGVTPNNSVGAANGNLVIAGLTAGQTYSVSYQKNGGAALIASNLVASGAGEVTVPSLGAGTYTNIVVTAAASSCGALSPLGPVTINSSCAATSGTFPW